MKIYSDRAVSGANLTRSCIQKLLRDAKARAFDVVLSKGLDRLSYSRADTAISSMRSSSVFRPIKQGSDECAGCETDGV